MHGTLSGSGWEVVDHTADVALEVRGEDMPALFGAAASGFIELMMGDSPVAESRSQELHVEGDDAEELLVSWLEEILYLFEARGLAPARAEIHEVKEGQVTGRLFGEPFDPDRHAVEQAVKAVTYHDLHIRREEGMYRARLIIDV
jgi:SHS2 domain-containing protein